MSLAKASLWTAASTLVKIGAGLLVVKLLAVSFGPAGVGQAGNFRQLVTVLGVLAGAGIFNGVTKLVAQHHDDRQQLNKVVGTSSAMVLGFSTLLALVWDDLAPAIAINYDKINLLKTLGPQSGLLATYGMLGLSLALVIWWEKHFFAKKARQNAAAAKLQTAL